MPNKTFFGLFFILQLTLSVAAVSYPTLALESTDLSANIDTENQSDVNAPHLKILLNTENFGVSNGLSQSTISSIVKDDKNYIWIGTLNGLNRFDGSHFEQYYANDGSGLTSSFITTLYYSSEKHLLLVGTNDGVFKYTPEKNEFEKYGSFSKKVTSITEFKNKIIVSGENSLTNKNGESLTSNLPSSDIKSVLSFGENRYYLTFDGKLFFNKKPILKNVVKIEKIKDELIALDGYKIKILKDGIVEHTFLDKYQSFSVKDEYVYTIDYNNVISKLTKKSKIYIGDIKPSENNKIQDILTTDNEIIFSTTNHGIIVIYPQQNLVNLSNVELNNNIWSIVNDGTEFSISGKQKNIKLYDKYLNLEKEIDTGCDGEKTISLSKDDIFVGCRTGLYKIKRDTLEISKIVDDTISIIKYLDNKETLYAGTKDGKLIIITIDKVNFKIQKIPVDLGNPIFDIISVKNILYIASQGGLYVISQKGDVKNLFSKEMLFCITYSKEEDSIYAGSQSKIIKFEIKSNKYIDFFSNQKAIFSISVKDNYLIASSIKEIILSDLKSNKNYIISDRNGSQQEYNSQSISYLKSSDNILLGGSEGVSVLNLKESIAKFKNNKKLATSLQSFYLFNKKVTVKNSKINKNIDFLDSITLNYNDYPFSFKFSSPNSGYTNIEYRYKLDGLDENWLTSQGSQLATYTNIPHGNYLFSVYAINPTSLNQGLTKSIRIKILPPWWLKTPAKILYLAVSLILLFLIFKSLLKRRQIQHQIAQSEERLKLSLWGSGDEMWDWDIETGKIYRSNIWGALEFPKDGQRSGKDGEESNIHPQDQERVNEALDKHFSGATEHFEVTYRVRSKDDEWLWILDRAKIVERDDKDHPLRMTGTIKNINSFKTAEEQLRLFERAIENISEGVFILDVDFKFVEVNEAACDITKYKHNEMIGLPLYFSKYSEEYNNQIVLLLKQQGKWNTEIEVLKGDHTEFLMELTIDAIYDEQGTLTHYVGVFSDISHRKKQEAELRRLTNNDLLTGLPNRSSLQVTLENLVKKDSHHTLMMMDLDNFKKINDSLGHQIGDELLKKVAERLKGIIPRYTNLYRLGGDEFAILIDNNPDIGSSAIIANDIIEAFRAPFELSEEILVVGVSIGIVLYPEDEQNEQALLRKADVAMYHAKSAGGNRYQFYSESLNRNALRQLEVESLIREALRDDLFEVYFQPKINVSNSKLAGMEALVRLNHPKHGLISPGEFIPLAEETGLIVEIGDVVLKKACFAAQNWREQGMFNGRVAVNLSSRQFALPDLQNRIENILELTKLPASNLELEITEGTVIKQPEKAIKVMHQLSKMGISLALDDFGTGYSSLSYLKRFPINTLKIDKAFVDDIDKSDRDLKMVDSIITIAHNMGLSVVGEGVEQAAQLSILKALKCEEIQGFIYSKAISKDEFTEYLLQDIKTDIQNSSVI